MNITSSLSSQVGDKTEHANKSVAEICLQNSDHLDEIASRISDQDNSLVSDCAEVFTLISETNPELIVPYTKIIIPLLSSNHTKTRWEAMHTIANIASLIPDQMNKSLMDIQRIALTDKSTIVRDYATISIGNYAMSSKDAAKQSFPLLKRILEVWKDKLASRVFAGLQNIATTEPSLQQEIVELISPYESNSKPSVSKAARHVLKHLQK